MDVPLLFGTGHVWVVKVPRVCLENTKERRRKDVGHVVVAQVDVWVNGYVGFLLGRVLIRSR